MCSCNAGSPVQPTITQPDRTAEFWGDVMPIGWHANGSLMSHEDLCYYFAAHMAETYLPDGMSNPQYCPLFKALKLFIVNHYPLAYQLVRFYERNLNDIPDALDIVAPCE